MKKAFAYLRVSGKGQVEGDGFPRQIEAVKKYAAAHDVKIVKVYREEGVSGTTDWDNRPAFSEMMAELLANGVRTVLVERLDRCARDLLVQESIIADFRRKGLEIVSVNEPDLCGEDPSRVLMRQILGAFFQYEKTLLVAKLKGARKRAKEANGICEGRKPYGTRPGEKEVVEKVLALREAKTTLERIAGILNADGIRPRSGGRWHASTVSNIVKRAANRQKSVKPVHRREKSTLTARFPPNMGQTPKKGVEKSFKSLRWNGRSVNLTPSWSRKRFRESD